MCILALGLAKAMLPSEAKARLGARMKRTPKRLKTELHSISLREWRWLFNTPKARRSWKRALKSRRRVILRLVNRRLEKRGRCPESSTCAVQQVTCSASQSMCSKPVQSSGKVWGCVSISLHYLRTSINAFVAPACENNASNTHTAFDPDEEYVLSGVQWQ